MKNINLKNITFQIIVVLFFVTQWVQAESGLGFEDDVQDVPQAPIDDYIIPAMVLIMLYGFYKHYKRRQLTKQHK